MYVFRQQAINAAAKLPKPLPFKLSPAQADTLRGLAPLAHPLAPQAEAGNGVAIVDDVASSRGTESGEAPKAGCERALCDEAASAKLLKAPSKAATMVIDDSDDHLEVECMGSIRHTASKGGAGTEIDPGDNSGAVRFPHIPLPLTPATQEAMVS